MRKGFPISDEAQQVIKETELSIAMSMPNVASLGGLPFHIVKDILILSVDFVPDL